jgi:IclR family pca regulon transcriptional regulator
MVQRQLVNSIYIGMKILESLTPKKRFYTLSEITEIVNAPKSSVFRLLKTFCRLDYLQYDTENKRYCLGPRILSLGFAFLLSLEIRDIVRPYLEKLARECDKTVNLTMLDKGEMVYIDKIKVHDLRDLNINIGERIPVHNTAAGKAVLAFMDPQRLLAIMKEIKRDGVVLHEIGRTGSRLFRALAEVRSKGYAIDDQEFRKGVRAVAVPILSPQGANYAISMVVASEIMSINELTEKYAPKLIKIGDEVSKATGCYGVKV